MAKFNLFLQALLLSSILETNKYAFSRFKEMSNNKKTAKQQKTSHFQIKIQATG